MEMTTLEQWIGEKIGTIPLTEEALRAYQLQKINKTIRYAKEHSSFYQQLYPNQLPSILDWQQISQLPFTRAEDIQTQGARMVCVPQEAIYRIVTLQTSGTTAKPKRIYFTEADQELTIDFFDHGMRVLTKKQDPVMILLPARTPGCVGDLLARGLERFGAVAHRYGIPQHFEETLTYMKEHQIQVIVANPEQMLALAYLAEQQHIDFNPRSILLSTDYVADSLMRQLAKRFHATVYEHYGMTEMGLGGGVSCQAVKGYHLRDADLYFEIIDPQTGENLPDGNWGEVVFTTLTRQAMPLIRYRTGDYGRFLTEPCPCGTVLKRLDKVYHRISGGPFRITDFDEALFAIDGIFNYQLNINRLKQEAEVILHTLQKGKDFGPQVQAALSPLLSSYQLSVRKAIGFRPEHYQLKKRQINYLS